MKKEAKERSTKKGKKILLCLIYLALFGFLAVFGFVLLGEGHIRQKGEPQKTEAIVVLGASVWADGPSPTLIRRMDRALALYEEGTILIACGGQGKDEPMSEAACMQAYFMERGVRESDILLDDTSTDTRENLQNARALMEEKKLTSCTVVTSDYHLFRALFLAKTLSMDAQGAYAETPWVWVLWKMRFREILAWGKVVLQLIHIL